MMFRALSLGWGTQSFGMAAMVALGELPMVDVAIHSDTTHETQGTYEFARKWTPWLEDHGVRVVTVQPPAAPLVDKWGGVMIPIYTAPNGQIKRQCTGDWKIDPIRRWLQANREGQRVELLIGITADEISRAKPANVKYIENTWPLLKRPYRRHEVKSWLLAHGLEVPPRSACTFCPFRSRAEWAEIKSSPDWEKVIAVDLEIRDKRPPGQLFLHRSRLPIDLVDLRSEQELGQMELWDAECEGVCGL